MMSSEQYRKLQKQSKRKLDKLEGARTGNKYHAKGQYYGGVFYDSTGEMEYAQKLDLRLRAKDIKSWRRQVKIELKVNGIFIANYYMDFEITHNDGTLELLEYKGAITTTWQMKFNLLKALRHELYPNGVTITLEHHKSKYNPFNKRK